MNSRAIRANSSQKPRCVGQGAYCVSAPPSSRAPVKPTAWAAVVTEAARFDCPTALKSTSAAVAVPAVRPTPMPVKARPANSHNTSGATANSSVPMREAPSPSNITNRRPMWSERSPKPTRTATTTIG